jgi:hypothetical protein
MDDECADYIPIHAYIIFPYMHTLYSHTCVHTTHTRVRARARAHTHTHTQIHAIQQAWRFPAKSSEEARQKVIARGGGGGGGFFCRIKLIATCCISLVTVSHCRQQVPAPELGHHGQSSGPSCSVVVTWVGRGPLRD